MEKLKNYILNGKGMGLLFLLASAVVMAVVSMFIFRSIYQDVKPSVILVAQDVLPVTIKNKEIVEPQNMYKKLSINIPIIVYLIFGRVLIYFDNPATLLILDIFSPD